MKVGRVHVIFQEECISDAAYYQTLEKINANREGHIDSVLYRSVVNQKLEDVSNNKSVEEITVIESDGRGGNFLLTSQPFVAGKMIDKEEKQSCVIDKKTALSMFGTAEAVGERVKWRGGIYTVCGILDTTEKVVIINRPRQEGNYQYVALKIHKKGDAQWEGMRDKEIIEDLLKTYTDRKPEIVVEEKEFAAMFRKFSSIPVYILFLWIVFTWKDAVIWRRDRNISWKKRLFALGLLLAYTGVFIGMEKIRLYMEPNMVDGSWFNFSFSQQKWSVMKQEFWTLFDVSTILDISILKHRIVKCLIYNMLMLFVFLIGVFYVWYQHKSNAVLGMKELYIGCVITVIAAWAAYATLGGGLPRVYLAFIPLGYCGIFWIGLKQAHSSHD